MLTCEMRFSLPGVATPPVPLMVFLERRSGRVAAFHTHRSLDRIHFKLRECGFSEDSIHAAESVMQPVLEQARAWETLRKL